MTPGEAFKRMFIFGMALGGGLGLALVVLVQCAK